ncbi:MAG TPA: LysM peptidoglycan-binding domain-containing protein [Anaerolineales bacterium]|nr:LysM peptidoglycan-binding domain-containing protein [Anaerolineales bacterium]
MSRKNRGITIASTLLLVAFLVSACQQPYSTPPAVTNTPMDPNSLFSTPLGEPDSMQDVENFITQTALAGEPGAAVATATPGDAAVATETSTPIIDLNPTATATQAVAVATTAAAPAASGSEWILRNGEFPYCIARRYNVDPTDLIKASGLSSPDIYYEGQKLIIPQNSTWPASLGSRTLLNHPSTYTVTGNSDLTIYGVACKYGEISPASIAQNNNLSVDAALTVGQTLNIP